ncbi:MAG: hypothetical protein M5U22_06005 [Thermoleophilia bacterium]|nr:hypothetical protein [Thermoleophilia bacterium]
MKLLVGEGVDAAIVARLRQAAFGVPLVRLPGVRSTGKSDAVSESVCAHRREMVGAA